MLPRSLLSDARSPPTASGSGSGSGSRPSNSGRSKGPPSLKPLVSKKIHRRSPRACDECRLRKRACDAGQPCSPCRRSDIECTYKFRRPVPRPTSRIRDLQEHLEQARGWLQQIKEKGSAENLDLDECLRVLDFTIPDQNVTSPPPGQASAGSSRESTHERHHNMLFGQNRLMEKDQGVVCFYGAYSDVSFILRTIELLETGSPKPQQERLRFISDLLNRPPNFHPDGNLLAAPAVDIPENAEALLDAVFERADPMLCFLPEQSLRNAAANPWGPEASVSTLNLLHMVLALGYLFNSKDHGGEQCECAWEHASRHFGIVMGAGVLGFPQDLISLQTILCAIVFLFTGYRTAVAHSLIGAACSAALRMGLLSRSVLSSEGAMQGERRTRIRVLGAVLVVDMLGSMLLDLPTFIHRDSISDDVLTELRVGAEAEGDLITAALLRQISLLAIPLALRATSSQSDGEDIRTFQKALDQCQRWRKDVMPLMAKLGAEPKYLCAKKDLDMMYSLNEIILFRPHLHYIKKMYAGEAVSVAESYYALACIKVASSTIGIAHEHRARPAQPVGESWLTIHTVFSAVICLVFLVAAHPATTLPSIAWQKARVGVRLIAANRCQDNVSAACIEVLKMVTHTLRRTIYIDFDKIEASTVSNCSKTGDTPSSISTDFPSALESGGRLLDAQLAGASHDHPMGEDGDEDVDSSSRVLSHFGVEMGNEADKMLEQAEALSINASLEDLLYFSSSE